MRLRVHCLIDEHKEYTYIFIMIGGWTDRERRIDGQLDRSIDIYVYIDR